MQLGTRTANDDSAPASAGQSRATARALPRPAAWRLRGGVREVDAGEQGCIIDAAFGSAQIVLLAKGERIRIRPDHGAIWIAAGSGLHCETAWYRVWCAHAEACVTEARHEVEVRAPMRQDSLVIGILPDAARLDRATTGVAGAAVPMALLFPQVIWPMPAQLRLPAPMLASWRQHADNSGADDTDFQGEVESWASPVIAACVEHQSSYRVLAAQCSGRTWLQKQAMLARLLRGSIAMQLQDKPNVADGARAALLSTWRFIALHREVFGETPARSAYRHRLEHALQQLRAGDLAVTDVAEIVGYRNRSSFSRAFKTRFGYSPMQVNRASEG